MRLRNLTTLVAVALAAALVAGPGSSARPSEPAAELRLLDQALLHHTALEPVLRGQRIMAGEDFSSLEASSPTPGVTQNGVCNDQKPEAQVGETRIFWVHNFKLGSDIQKPFRLLAKTPHVYMWVDETQVGTLVTTEQAHQAAEAFESLYATNRQYFGREAQCDQLPHRQPPRLEGIWGSPWYDADDDRHINIVNFDPDVGATVVAGYYSPGDEYPKTVNEHSNEGEFFYMNSLLFAPGGATYTSILAHEFYHMVQFANDANEETWVNEGMADVAIEVNGFGDLTSSHTSDYANHPEDQLTDWAGGLADYGNAYSFFSYFLEHYGPADDPATPFKENYALAEQITKVEADGLEGIDEILAANPYRGGLAPYYRDRTANDVYLDRAVANVVNDRSVGAGQWGYGQLSSFRVNAHGGSESYPAEESGSANPYGDRIYVFESSADGSFTVDAPAEVPIVPNEAGMPSPAHELWGNRGDEMFTFADRAADLTGATSPHLRFHYWYDIEEDWDYAYLQVSDDGGATWTNLACPCGSRTTNPNGNNQGNGITGRSGAVLPTDGASWQLADVDLSAYAGQQIVVRFAYQTDAAVTRPGFTVDDVELVDGSATIWQLATFEAGLDGFTLGGGGAKTFLRIEPNQANELTLQIVKLGNGVDVSRHGGFADGETSRASGAMDAFRTIAIFTSLTPITSEAFDYTWRAEASPLAALTPPELTATGGAGRVDLRWTPGGDAGSLPPRSYLVQESTVFGDHVHDDAESGLDQWRVSTSGLGALGWSASESKSNSPSHSFWGSALEGATNAESILTYAAPISLPSGGRTTLGFWEWHMNESDDSVAVEVREAGASEWTSVYRAGRSALPDVAGPSFALEPLSERAIDLSAYQGKTIELRFVFRAGPDNRAGSTPYGWYVDDVEVVTEGWQTVGETAGTSLTLTRAAGTYFYRVAALYSDHALGPWSNVDAAEVTAAQADLSISAIEAASNTGSGGKAKQPREGDKVVVRATVTNAGAGPAAASQSAFLLDGTTTLGVVDTPALAPGESAVVAVDWDTRGVQGEHTIRVTADSGSAVTESDEGNNASTLTVTVKGNKVTNGSFEASSSGSSPDAWTSSGSTGYAEGGSDGNRSVTAAPGGSWTSAPIAVMPGGTYELTLDASGAAGTVVVEQLLDNGTVLPALTLTLPATVGGAFEAVSAAVSVAEGVGQIRVRLAGGLAGTTVFDNVRLTD